jgi:hypothetical protein
MVRTPHAISGWLTSTRVAHQRPAHKHPRHFKEPLMTATSPPTRLLAVAGTAALGISIAACGATVTHRTTPVTARPITSTAPSPVPSVHVAKSI